MSAILTPYGLALLTLVAGLVFGVIHFTSLRAVTALLLSGEGRTRAVALQLLRMGLAVTVFVGFAFAGALPLLTGALGFLLGRAIVLRRTKAET